MSQKNCKKLLASNALRANKAKYWGISRENPMEKEINKVLVFFILLAILLNLYIYLAPYNTIADEEGYITQALSFTTEEPIGWNIRSFFYPAMLSVPAFFLKMLGASEYEQMSGVRLANWGMMWLAVICTFLIGKKVFNTKIALMGVFFMLVSWFWIMSGKRVMMDVPSTAWIMLSFYFMVLGVRERANVFLSAMFSMFAVLTKFQTGPIAVVILLVLVLHPHAKGKKIQNAKTLFSAVLIVLVTGGAIDLYTHGQAFGSLINFIGYNFGNAEAFEDKYGSCGSVYYYLTHIPDIYSYIFPIFIAVGLVISVLHYQSSMPIVICSLVYLVVIHGICHKQIRYLSQLAPVFSLLGALGIAWLAEKVSSFVTDFTNGNTRKLIHTGIYILPIIIISLSFVPRNEIDEILMTESCTPFSHQFLQKNNDAEEDSLTALVVPCTIPNYLARKHKVDYVDAGFNEYTRKRNREAFRANLSKYDYIILKRGSAMEDILIEEAEGIFSVLSTSAQGHYSLYSKNGLITK